MTFEDTTLRVGVAADAKGYSASERLGAGKPSAGEKRRAGRTRRMIMDLPKDGAVVIVHSPSVIGIFRDLIRSVRGNEVADATRVVAAPTVLDELAVVRRLSLPVFRDHFVEEQREHARGVLHAWRQ
ncbi:hypothetical protein ABID82_007189 [Methylobacterium sp. PvP062]|uniref:Uncharacterized protein n=1 Tax=Methylobacterium radiotolerans TaxID=31998 RepID=A0ABV2NQ33_9HYPH|nr:MULTISPECIES: hypothetical protein [unclassified Methylobacterium]MBP2494690.1 hypothetical protein [Methylobacterium sp. PvP105]MBP2505439.1 hypothetical protein [Methylobacterium sp. PvP109]MCX7336354.1 hypothetical protein [Hyphomicrobiales bacterium]